MALNETRRPSYGLPTSSSAQRTRVSRASPLPPSGDRSKAVIVMVIVALLCLFGRRPAEDGFARGESLVEAAPRGEHGGALEARNAVRFGARFCIRCERPHHGD